MTAPLAPTWLDTGDVRAWLRIPATEHADDDLVSACSAAVEPQVERARPDQYTTDPDDPDAGRTYTPDAEVYQAAVMLAGRLYRRRNSPGGVETFADSIAYVSRWDPDIQRALHQGSWGWPGVG